MSAKSLFTLHAIAALLLLGLGLGAQAPSLTVADSEVNKITVDNLARELQRQGVVHWRVVLAQAIIETGWEFNSAIFKNANNFIGMRIPSARPSTRSGAYKGYSAYTNWQDCVADIKLWQDHFWPGGSRDQYIAKLHRVWAQSPDYAAHLHKLVLKFDERFPANA